MAPRNESGQATVEIVGLVVIVALVLVAAGGIAAIAAPGLSNRITTAMQRALCTVAGEACPALEREPCPMLRTDRTLATRLTVGWIRLGDDRAIAIERRSDGTYVVSLVEGIGAGVGAIATRGGFEGSADALLTGRAGRTWIASDRARAEALVRRLRKRALPGAEALVHGAADLVGLAGAEDGVEAYVVSGRGAVSAAAKLGLGSIVEGGVEGKGSVELGLRVAAHRKEATAYVSVDGRVGAFFDALPAASLPRGSAKRRPGRSSSDREDEEPLGSLLNPDKLHRDIEAVAGGTIALRLAPGPRVLEMEVTAYAGVGGDRRELHARVDPQIPEVAAALSAWRADPASAERLADLGRAAAAGAAIDERRFRIQTSERDYGGAIGSGAGLGLEATRGLETAELIEQRSRPVGGVWERRLDCEAA